MRMTRRRFLAWIAVAAGAAGVAGLIPRRRLIRRLFEASLPPTSPGPLDPRTTRTLLAATRALLGEPLEISHYEDYFRWRASHLPGYRSLYSAFAATLERAARGAGHADFAALPPERQRRILAGMVPARGWARLQRGLFGRERERYSRYVVEEIFQRFCGTDAFLRIGYDSWPGTPRGFDFYRKDSARS